MELKNKSFAFKLFIGVAFPAIILFGIVFSFLWALNKQEQLNEWIVQTRENIKFAALIEDLMFNSRIKLMDFLYSGNPEILELFQKGEMSLIKSFDEKSINIKGSYLKVSQLEKVERLHNQWLEKCVNPVIKNMSVPDDKSELFSRIAKVREGNTFYVESLFEINKFIENENDLLLNQQKDSKETINIIRIIILISGALSIFGASFLSYLIFRDFSVPIESLLKATNRISKGEFAIDIGIHRNDELGKLSNSFQEMTNSLNMNLIQNAKENWLKSNQTEFIKIIDNEKDINNFGNVILSFVSEKINAQLGAFYVNMNGTLKMISCYAYSNRIDLSKEIQLGEGLVGQAALDKKMNLISPVPKDYSPISSGLGECQPTNIIVVPVIYDGVASCVFEFATTSEFIEQYKLFLDNICKTTGVALFKLIARQKIEENAERTRMIIETAVDGIITFDEAGIIESMNHSATKQFGYSLEEIIGKNIKMLMPLLVNEKHEDNLIKIDFELSVKNIIGLGKEVIGKRKNGSQFPILLSVGEMSLQGKMIFTGIIRDITIQKKAELDLQTSNEELQTQQEELKAANEELIEQSRYLQEAQKVLAEQQQKLNATNIELEEQTQSLEEKKELLESRNTDLEKARVEIKKKMVELEISSKYKSEFLANMSHELRTPLNSLMILSKLLQDNKEGNLTEKQLKFSQTIYQSGNDLLSLIEDILDLSKVEAGKLDMYFEELDLKTLIFETKNTFKPLTDQKGLSISTTIEDLLPATIRTDSKRIRQIFKNLLSNALKFTSTGGISIVVGRPLKEVQFSNSNLVFNSTIAFSIIDTGIGIPIDKQVLIFEAFQQADSGTSRIYGGTGLGLSIARELAKLLGGEIQLTSEVGKGSTFTFFLPEKAIDENIKMTTIPNKSVISPLLKTSSSNPTEYDGLSDDRKTLTLNDKSILIVEDDLEFAKIICDFSREKGFKILLASDGPAGVHMADYYRPSVIILDINLPKADGWYVMDALKKNPNTRHIPVHLMSAYEETPKAKEVGAIGYLSKPTSVDGLEKAFNTIENMLARSIKKLLIIEDDSIQRQSILELIASDNLEIVEAQAGQEAYEKLNSSHFDCVILDLGLKGSMNGFELIEKLKLNKNKTYPPIIVYTGKVLSKEEEATLQKYSSSIIIKGAASPERLLDEVSLFLHFVEKDLPEMQKKILKTLHSNETKFEGKLILVVDDDMRNVFALSNVLEEKGMQVLIGNTGKEALSILKENPQVDLILMDIMMPEMDGYESIQEIRKLEPFKKLPIIALTAKAMMGEREKCIEAGASDYLSKPIDVDRLLSLMRVWLHK